MPSTNKKNRGKGKKQKSEKKQIVTSKKSKCTGCDKIGEDFKVCSACKMAKYCTSSCQRAHWPEHKSTCKVLALNLMGLGKPKLRFKVGDRVRCSVGDWEPWVHGTIELLWFQSETGEWPYSIICDNGEWIKAPEDDDFCIRKLTPPIPRQPNLFEENPPREECPICFLRMPMSNDGVYKACCGQILCLSCTMQSQSRDHKKCPFCREDENVSNEEHIQRIKDRMDKHDPEAFHLLAYYHDIGTRDIAQDSRKAHKLWEQAAELGTRNAHYHLSKSYSVYYNERGVEKEEEKAIFHLETAAIMGDAASRCELGRYEQTMGNWEYAKKHWMLSAAAGCENCMGFRIKQGFLNGAVTKDEYNQTLNKYQKTIEETKSEQRDADRAERKQHDPHHGQCWPGSLDSEIKPY